MKTEILGVKIDNLTREEISEKIDGFLADGRQHYLVLPYSEFIVQAAAEPEFLNLLNRADLSLCESRGLFLTLKLLGRPVKEQVAGVDLVRQISRKHPGVFLLGGREGVAERAARILGANITGVRDGYRGLAAAVESINQVRPEILFVALGMPKQEKWINENLNKMPSVKLAVGVGGAFDFISGRIKRAPRFARQSGLEWLWRFCRQPWRLKRIFKAGFVFPWLMIKEKLSTKK